MKVLAAFLAAAALAGPAMAEPVSEVLFSHKAWQVMAVAFDDGSISCDAEVSDPGESFSIWIHQDNSVQLVFFSSQWDFGEGDTADLQVEIDRRSPWRLRDAELYQSSVLFTLGDADSGARFINEVARGNVLFLRTAEGEDVQSYSLAGSRAAIDALFECGDALPSTAPANPFKN